MVGLTTQLESHTSVEGYKIFRRDRQGGRVGALPSMLTKEKACGDLTAAF